MQTAQQIPEAAQIQAVHPTPQTRQIPVLTEIQLLPQKAKLLLRVKAHLRQVQTEMAVITAIVPVLPEMIPQNCFCRNKNKRRNNLSACMLFRVHALFIYISSAQTFHDKADSISLSAPAVLHDLLSQQFSPAPVP